jgi:hypothetical protein
VATDNHYYTINPRLLAGRIDFAAVDPLAPLLDKNERLKNYAFYALAAEEAMRIRLMQAAARPGFKSWTVL